MTPNPALLSVATGLFICVWFGYLMATILYVSAAIRGGIKKGSRTDVWAFRIQTLGTTLHLLAILVRWQGAGYWPTSNMFEFLGFMGFTSMVAFQVLNRMYRLPALGALVTPVGLILVTYAYVFPHTVQPLIPALQSYWLPIHVSMAALGEGFFAVAFGAALLYLLRTHHQMSDSEKKWGGAGLEFLFYLTSMLVSFLLLAVVFRYTGSEWWFGSTVYHLPPLIGPNGFPPGSAGTFLGLNLPLVEVGVKLKGKHFNTLFYAIFFGAALYWGIRRFVTKGRIGDYLADRVHGDAELMDEISYRAVAIGYPVFTLGALIFAMIWAKEAWTRYWAWDPKETWALIAWLVYSAYLHMRITRGWDGRKSAWIAVLGFGVILFTLVGVNLLIVGLHSYAGGD